MAFPTPVLKPPLSYANPTILLNQAEKTDLSYLIPDKKQRDLVLVVIRKLYPYAPIPVQDTKQACFQIWNSIVQLKTISINGIVHQGYLLPSQSQSQIILSFNTHGTFLSSKDLSLGLTSRHAKYWQLIGFDATTSVAKFSLNIEVRIPEQLEELLKIPNTIPVSIESIRIQKKLYQNLLDLTHEKASSLESDTLLALVDLFELLLNFRSKILHKTNIFEPPNSLKPFNSL